MSLVLKTTMAMFTAHNRECRGHRNAEFQVRARDVAPNIPRPSTRARAQAERAEKRKSRKIAKAKKKKLIAVSKPARATPRVRREQHPSGQTSGVANSKPTKPGKNVAAASRAREALDEAIEAAQGAHNAMQTALHPGASTTRAQLVKIRMRVKQAVSLVDDAKVAVLAAERRVKSLQLPAATVAQQCNTGHATVHVVSTSDANQDVVHEANSRASSDTHSDSSQNVPVLVTGRMSSSKRGLDISRTNFCGKTNGALTARPSSSPLGVELNVGQLAPATATAQHHVSCVRAQPRLP